MTGPASFPSIGAPALAPEHRPDIRNLGRDEISDIGQRFEQMLWAEMLSHAGLDKAFEQGGGEAASAFSRYVVEPVAKDIAATHPLGLAEAVERNITLVPQPRMDKTT